MKKIFKFVGLGGLLAAIFAVGAVMSFAQDPCADVDGINNLYNEVLANYKGPEPEKMQKGVDSAKQFLEKYGSCETAKAQVDWMKPKVPVWEDNISKLKKKNQMDALYGRFNAGFKTPNWDEVYSSGKEILAVEPDNLDAILVLGSVGFDQTAKKNNKYNDDTLKYARMALEKMKAGVTSKTYGIYQYKYDTKDNAAGWMNLVIGYITYYGKDDKKGALPYMYQASLTGPETPTNPIVYETIGKYFLGETIRLRDEVKAMIADQKDTDPEDVKVKKEADIKAKIALLNGNAERAIDGYAHAYNVAKTDAATKAYRDGLYAKIKDLYSVRFQKDTGIDEYITATNAKPVTDPSAAVVPVESPEADVTKTSSSPTPTATPAKPAGTKPGETSGVTKAATAKETAPSAKPNTVAVKKANH
jgi:hypothetical protein